MKTETLNHIMMDSFSELGYQMRGLKSCVITIQNDCNRCHGRGKDSFFDDPDIDNGQLKEVDCPICGGSGSIETIVNINVTKEPVKKEKAKK